ncbi:D-amino-acid dehydrogenase [Chryseobacterium bernardetii]|uniref:D-amino-acid dehydrogenase n=2 Tax=Chryseobacterium TaxID=59732 RepID=A0A543EJ84_9FLAO|nr:MULTISPECIES: FAD-dependent oxidoreductase [Chryseobacterium]MDR6370064.1 D-amino-acid dehydrogenase [Chryseobacterium vietnamense]MDR6440693.1 D-amino-acid dehydrogenase [Chryseobacterium bernardetii]TQM21626.1 D-amino-acid dehydrogenase [Chryseobacterium aquifrigidense]
MTQNKGKALIIGAGIAGLSSAYYLLQKGWQVEIIEQNDLTNNCSYGNAGMIVPSHFTPLAAPGVVAQGMRWMFDSKSPFYVKPSLNAKLISWGLKFLKHSNQKHVDYSAAAIRDLNLASSRLYNEIAKQDDFDFELNQNGILMLYKTEKVAEEEIELAHKATGMGLPVDILDKKEIQQLEPNVQLDVIGGVNYKCDGHMNPMKLMKQMISYLKNKGVIFHTHHQVTGFEFSGSMIKAVIANDRKFTADRFVMTGGSFLPELAQKAGIKIQLMPGKGYSFMHTPDNPVNTLNHAALLLEARVAVTPMNGQVRFGGTMELASHHDTINMKRVEGIIRSIPQYLPDFQIQNPKESEIWFGYRPCAPDGLPYLGQSSQLKNLIIAGGGGMMGLSLGPIFGKTVSELANDQKPTVDIKIFNPERFS